MEKRKKKLHWCSQREKKKKATRKQSFRMKRPMISTLQWRKLRKLFSYIAILQTVFCFPTFFEAALTLTFGVRFLHSTENTLAEIWAACDTWNVHWFGFINRASRTAHGGVRSKLTLEWHHTVVGKRRPCSLVPPVFSRNSWRHCTRAARERHLGAGAFTNWCM